MGERLLRRMEPGLVEQWHTACREHRLLGCHPYYSLFARTRFERIGRLLEQQYHTDKLNGTCPGCPCSREEGAHLRRRMGHRWWIRRRYKQRQQSDVRLH